MLNCTLHFEIFLMRSSKTHFSLYVDLAVYIVWSILWSTGCYYTTRNKIVTGIGID